jgi:hypothetical protein
MKEEKSVAGTMILHVERSACQAMRVVQNGVVQDLSEIKQVSKGWGGGCAKSCENLSNAEQCIILAEPYQGPGVRSTCE